MRVKAVFAPADFVASEGASSEQSAAMFATMFPGVDDPAFDANHAGMAVVAVNPGLALQMRALSAFMLTQMPFGRRPDLRELAILTANRKLGSTYGFETRRGAARVAGLSEEVIDALPALAVGIKDEQRLVVTYAAAVVDNAVDDALLAAFTARFGETAAVECASLVGFWSCWAMILNVARP